MIDILEPLANQAGVRVVALVTRDGVPVAVPGRDADDGPAQQEEQVPFTDGEALAALSVGLLDELGRGVALLSGATPERVVLRAARGTLIMQRAAGAVLVVVLRGGLDPDELRLPMDGAAARILRNLRSMGRSDKVAMAEPRGALPVRDANPPEQAH